MHSQQKETDDCFSILHVVHFESENIVHRLEVNWWPLRWSRKAILPRVLHVISRLFSEWAWVCQHKIISYCDESLELRCLNNRENMVSCLFSWLIIICTSIPEDSFNRERLFSPKLDGLDEVLELMHLKLQRWQQLLRPSRLSSLSCWTSSSNVSWSWNHTIISPSVVGQLKKRTSK